MPTPDDTGGKGSNIEHSHYISTALIVQHQTPTWYHIMSNSTLPTRRRRRNILLISKSSKYQVTPQTSEIENQRKLWPFITVIVGIITVTAGVGVDVTAPTTVL